MDRKQKIEALNGLLTGKKTLDDLLAFSISFMEFTTDKNIPGKYYDKQGKAYTMKEMYDHVASKRGPAWHEVKSY